MKSVKDDPSPTQDMAAALERAAGRPAHSWLERIDVISKLLLSLATLVLSGAIGFATIHYNRQAAQRQIQNQIDSLALQRRTTAAQILVSQLPTVLRGAETDRALTLRLLEVVDPDLVRQIGESLLDQAKSSVAVKQAKQIIASSVTKGREYALAQHIENAQKYRDFELYAAAAREYMKAYEMLPTPAQQRLTSGIQSATKDYNEGNYSAALQMFEEAFKDVKSPILER